MEMCFELNTCFSWKFLRADERYDYCFRSMCTIWTWTSMNLWANNQVGLIPGGELRHSDLLCGQTRKHGCDLSWTQVKGDKWSLKAFSGPWTSLSTPRGWDENSSQFTTPTPTPPPSFFFPGFTVLCPRQGGMGTQHNDLARASTQITRSGVKPSQPTDHRFSHAVKRIIAIFFLFTVANKKRTKLTHLAFNPEYPVLIVGDDR